MKKFGILLGLLLVVLGAEAQQDPLFTQYRNNMLTINPAYAGSRDALTVALLHRSQWVGIDGAPRTQTLSVHGPLLNRNLGLGFSLVHDRIGPNRQTGMYLDFAGRIKVSRNGYLAGGIKIGTNFFNANLTDLILDNPADADFANNFSNTLFNVGVGVYYYTNKWFAGLSAPKLIENRFFDNTERGEVTEKQHYFATAGLMLDLSPAIKFRPTTLIRVVNGAPGSWDLTASFIFNDKLWLGAFNRWDESVGFLIDYNLTPQFKIGYSYDVTTSELIDYNSGSHEISLVYDFIYQNKKIKSPRYF